MKTGCLSQSSREVRKNSGRPSAVGLLSISKQIDAIGNRSAETAHQAETLAKQPDAHFNHT